MYASSRISKSTVWPFFRTFSLWELRDVMISGKYPVLLTLEDPYYYLFRMIAILFFLMHWNSFDQGSAMHFEINNWLIFFANIKNGYLSTSRTNLKKKKIELQKLLIIMAYTHQAFTKSDDFDNLMLPPIQNNMLVVFLLSCFYTYEFILSFTNDPNCFEHYTWTICLTW